MTWQPWSFLSFSLIPWYSKCYSEPKNRRISSVQLSYHNTSQPCVVINNIVPSEVTAAGTLIQPQERCKTLTVSNRAWCVVYSAFLETGNRLLMGTTTAFLFLSLPIFVTAVDSEWLNTTCFTLHLGGYNRIELQSIHVIFINIVSFFFVSWLVSSNPNPILSKQNVNSRDSWRPFSSSFYTPSLHAHCATVLNLINRAVKANVVLRGWLIPVLSTAEMGFFIQRHKLCSAL